MVKLKVIREISDRENLGYVSNPAPPALPPLGVSPMDDRGSSMAAAADGGEPG